MRIKEANEHTGISACHEEKYLCVNCIVILTLHLS